MFQWMQLTCPVVESLDRTWILLGLLSAIRTIVAFRAGVVVKVDHRSWPRVTVVARRAKVAVGHSWQFLWDKKCHIDSVGSIRSNNRLEIWIMSSTYYIKCWVIRKQWSTSDNISFSTLVNFHLLTKSLPIKSIT